MRVGGGEPMEIMEYWHCEPSVYGDGRVLWLFLCDTKPSELIPRESLVKLGFCRKGAWLMF